MNSKVLKRNNNTDKKKSNEPKGKDISKSMTPKEFIKILLEKLSLEDSVSIAFGIIFLIYKNNFKPISRDSLYNSILEGYRKDKKRYVKFKKERGSTFPFNSESQLKIAFDKVLEENKSLIKEKTKNGELVTLNYEETINHIKILPRSYLYNLFGEDIFKLLFPEKYQKIISSIKPFLRKNEEMKNKNNKPAPKNKAEEENTNAIEKVRPKKSKGRNKEKIISLSSSDEESEEMEEPETKKKKKLVKSDTKNNKNKKKKSSSNSSSDTSEDLNESNNATSQKETNKATSNSKKKDNKSNESNNLDSNENDVDEDGEDMTDNNSNLKNMFDDDSLNNDSNLKSQIEIGNLSKNLKSKNEIINDEMAISNFNLRKDFIFSLPNTLKDLKEKIHLIKDNSEGIKTLFNDIYRNGKQNEGKDNKEAKKKLIGELGNNKSLIDLSYNNIKYTINSINNINDISQNFNNKEILDEHKNVLEKYENIYNNAVDGLSVCLKQINDISEKLFIKEKYNELNKKYSLIKEKGLLFSELEDLIKDIEVIINKPKNRVDNFFSVDEIKENFLSKKRKLINFVQK